MVLLEIDTDRVALLPLKRDTPRTIYPDTVPPHSAPKSMKAKSGHSEVFQRLGLVQRVQTRKAPPLQIRSNLCAAARQKQLLQHLVPEILITR